jgi:hypothetical protein
MREIVRGDGRRVGLGSVLQLAEAESLTGRLTWGAGSIAVSMGAPVDARLRELSGFAAVREMFLTPALTFALEQGETPAGRPFADASTILLEGCRLQDEWARVAPMVLRKRADVPIDLPFDGRTVEAMVDAAKIPRLHVVDAVLAAIEAGKLEVVRMEAPLAAPADVEPATTLAFDDLLDVARQLVREGRLADARAQLENALRLRPNDRVAAQNLRRITLLEKAS